jgi:hypothetical protein
MATKHVKLEYSRKKIAKAGDNLLLKDELNESIIEESYDILSNWRSSHIYPMQKIQKILTKQAPKIDKNAIVVQRLKRTASILNKLDRYEEMKLHRMQDIGGCRVILAKVENVIQLKSALEKNRAKHEIIKINDYISEPKDSGYRGIHIIFRYVGTTNFDYDKHLVEVQLRTKLQHAWATAVEIMGSVLNQSLKTSQGSPDYLDTFKDISKILSFYEGIIPAGYTKENVEENLFKIIMKNNLITELSHRLASFSIGTKYISHGKSNGYYLVELDMDEGKVKTMHFNINEMDIATEKYLEKEKEKKNNVVLVSATSLNNLKKAYPNYFADSTLFVKTMNSIIDKFIKKFST